MFPFDLIQAHWRANPNFRSSMVLSGFLIFAFVVGLMSGYGMGMGSTFDKEKAVMLERLPEICADYYCNNPNQTDLNAVATNLFLDFNFELLPKQGHDGNDS